MPSTFEACIVIKLIKENAAFIKRDIIFKYLLFE